MSQPPDSAGRETPGPSTPMERAKRPAGRQRLAKGLVILLGVVVIGWLLYQAPFVREFGVGCLGRLGRRRSLFSAAPWATRTSRSGSPPRTPSGKSARTRRHRWPRASRTGTRKCGGRPRRAWVISARKARPPPRRSSGRSRTRNARVRVSAIRALWIVGVDADAAIPALIAALRDADDPVREAAGEGLWRLGVADDRVVAALTEALADPEAGVRAQAAESLGRLRPGTAAAAVPARRRRCKTRTPASGARPRKPWNGSRRRENPTIDNRADASSALPFLHKTGLDGPPRIGIAANRINFRDR